jgi:hypothetical protein
VARARSSEDRRSGPGAGSRACMMTAPDRGKTPNVSPPAGRRTRGSAVAAGDPRRSPVISQDRARSVTTLRDRGRAELQGCKAMTKTIIMRGAAVAAFRRFHQ